MYFPQGRILKGIETNVVLNFSLIFVFNMLQRKSWNPRIFKIIYIYVNYVIYVISEREGIPILFPSTVVCTISNLSM